RLDEIRRLERQDCLQEICDAVGGDLAEVARASAEDLRSSTVVSGLQRAGYYQALDEVWRAAGFSTARPGTVDDLVTWIAERVHSDSARVGHEVALREVQDAACVAEGERGRTAADVAAVVLA